jgi:hypothetical protein
MSETPKVLRQPVTGKLTVLDTRTGRVLPRPPTVDEAWAYYQERLGSSMTSEQKAQIERAYRSAWHEVETR